MAQITSVVLEPYTRAIIPTLRLSIGVLNNTQNIYSVVTGEGEFLTRDGGRISSIEYLTGATLLPAQQQMEAVFAIELNQQKLNRLEDIRKGEDFYYRLRASLTVLNRTNNQTEKIPLDVADPEGRMAHSDWVSMMRDFGVFDLRLIEVRFPTGLTNQVYEGAYEHFETARNHYDDGIWKSAIASSRDVIETFLSGDTGPIQQALGEEKWKRVSDMLKKSKHFMAVGAHTDEVIPYEELTRHDAEFSILSAQAALKYFSESVVSKGST